METVGIVGVVVGLVVALGAALKAWLNGRDREQRRLGTERLHYDRAKAAQKTAKAIDAKSSAIRKGASEKVKAARREAAAAEAKAIRETRQQLSQPVDDAELERLLALARSRRPGGGA